ncbi:FAD-dependent monooxygenase, partial [Photobacterium damselae]
GGGMVGAATAIRLAQQGFRVAVVETHQPVPFHSSQPADLRVSAISPNSISLLQQLGAWDTVMAMRVCPFKRLETWDAPECRTRFHADELNVPWLGYIVENRVIQLALWQQFESYPNITHVETELAQQDITWQQFTPQGPRSFLPLPGHQGSLVWYDAPERIRKLSHMPAEQLEQEIYRHFPAELGKVTVVNRGSFPLTRRHAQCYAQSGVVLLGDAAHTINPLAGQGVNLGFKDVLALLDEVEMAGENWAQATTYQRYERRRRPDNLLMQSGMDLFYTVFSNTLPPLQLLRNVGLRLADKAGPVKKQLLKYAMGI